MAVNLRKGSMADLPTHLKLQLKKLEDMFTVSTEKLKEITEHFVSELKRGLATEEGDHIPMNPSWCMAFPTGHEVGAFLAIDMGGTNLRVCEVNFPENFGEFDIIQSKYRMPIELKTGTANHLWKYVAECVQQFVEYHHEGEDIGSLPLGFTFSYPVTQESVDHGVLQRWTKGFDVEGVEGHDVVPQFTEAVAKYNLPIRLTALVNDTVGTLIASAYKDTKMKIGCIFGTGCNAAYMDVCGNVPKLAKLNLDPELPMAINCEWGAFDNDHKVLPRTKYDVQIDGKSPRPGQQTYEKMVAGLYLGEILRVVLLDLHKDVDCNLFGQQSVDKLLLPYSLDSSFLSKVEEDVFENLDKTAEMFESTLSLTPTKQELEFIRHVVELIGTRSARLTACGIAAICVKQEWSDVHVGADGSLFSKYPQFKQRQAAAIGEILDWDQKYGKGKYGKGAGDPVEVLPAEDGSGVGAALIAALTLKRAHEGNWAGIKNREGIEMCLKHPPVKNSIALQKEKQVKAEA